MEAADTLVAFGEWFNETLGPAIERFILMNKARFGFQPIDSEQPLENLKVYGEYKEYIDSLASQWLQDKGMSDRDLMSKVC